MLGEESVSYLCVELVVTEVEGGVDGLERLKVNGHLLLLALVSDNGATVQHKAILWHAWIALQALLC